MFALTQSSNRFDPTGLSFYSNRPFPVEKHSYCRIGCCSMSANLNCSDRAGPVTTLLSGDVKKNHFPISTWNCVHRQVSIRVVFCKNFISIPSSYPTTTLFYTYPVNYEFGWSKNYCLYKHMTQSKWHFAFIRAKIFQHLYNTYFFRTLQKFTTWWLPNFKLLCFTPVTKLFVHNEFKKIP